MAIRHFNQIELAARWNISHRTLERWRWSSEGPRFIKIGGRVVYRLEDVEAYEAARLRETEPVTSVQPRQLARYSPVDSRSTPKK